MKPNNEPGDLWRVRGTEWVATGKVTHAIPKDGQGRKEEPLIQVFGRQVKIAF